MKKFRGFTLVELLVVLAIVTILATIGMNGYTQNLKRARDTRRQAELQEIRVALETYRADNLATGYPSLASGTDLAAHSEFGTDYLSGTVPADVLRAFPYYYVRTSATTYELCAHLEAPAPAVMCTVGDGVCCSGDCSGGTDPNWTCNYRVIQP